MAPWSNERKLTPTDLAPSENVPSTSWEVLRKPFSPTEFKFTPLRACVEGFPILIAVSEDCAPLQREKQLAHYETH